MQTPLIDLSGLEESSDPSHTLLVEHKRKKAVVLLGREPAVGYLWIRYEDGSGIVEVAIGKCKMILLAKSEEIEKRRSLQTELAAL